MSFSSRFLKLLVPLLFVAAIPGCAMRDQDLRESLQSTKQRLDEAKKDKELRRESTPILYEADLYWRRAWAAQDDAAKANHLLFMAQGKLAMAQSVAAMRNAERKLQLNCSAQITAKSTQNDHEEQGNSSTKTTIAVSADAVSSRAQSKDTESEAENAFAVKPAPQDEKPQRPLEDDSTRQGTVVSDKPTPRMDIKEPYDVIPDSKAEKTEPIAHGDIAIDPMTEGASGNGDILEQVKNEGPQAPPATEIAAGQVNDHNTSDQLELPASEKKPTEGQTASLITGDRLDERIGAEEAIPTKQPDADFLEQGRSFEPGKSSQDTSLTGFHVNIPAYCRRIIAMVKGSSEVEKKCRELEIVSRNRLATLRSDTPAYKSIFKYCSNVARVLGSGYQIMELCVDQELGLRPDTGTSAQGFVMGDPGSETKKSTEDSKPAPDN